MQRRIITQITPIIGIKLMSSHQPLLLTSCNLLIPTARPGINTAKAYNGYRKTIKKTRKLLALERLSK